MIHIWKDRHNLLLKQNTVLPSTNTLIPKSNWQFKPWKEITGNSLSKQKQVFSISPTTNISNYFKVKFQLPWHQLLSPLKWDEVFSCVGWKNANQSHISPVFLCSSFVLRGFVYLLHSRHFTCKCIPPLQLCKCFYLCHSFLHFQPYFGCL